MNRWKHYGRSRRIQQLKFEIGKQRTRLKEPHLSSLTVESLRRHVQFLLGEVDRLEREWLQALKLVSTAYGRYQLALSVPQIGPICARVLVCELPDEIGSIDKGIGLAGLAPKPNRSGSSLNGRDRLPFHCNKRIKAVLYMPAVQALYRSPELRDFYMRLVGNGKAPKVALTAIMRKLLRRTLEVIVRGTPWEHRHKGLDNP